MHTITVTPMPVVGAGFQPDDPQYGEYLQRTGASGIFEGRECRR